MSCQWLTVNLFRQNKFISAEGVRYIQFSGSGTGTVSHLKIEKGSAATDWCLNPSEILIQSDYAKIKAAIVALGGYWS